MKKLFLSMMLTMVAAGVCFAQPYGGQKANSSQPVTGMIVAVTPADSAKGTKPELKISVDGKEMIFWIQETTTIYDAGGKALTLKDLTSNQKVKVNYATTKDGEEATSVWQVK